MVVNLMIAILPLVLINAAYGEISTKKIPTSFLFGAATSSYQIEGGWDADGKGENIWDHLTHNFPEKIKDRKNGDVACDSYNQYLRDVEMLAELGVNYYRFSISWARIMPSGLPNEINQKGIDYYDNLVNALLAKGIKPMVTMYHWDLPQRLQDIGGWANPRIVNIFRDYARVLFDSLGDRVTLWTTFNEPKQVCQSSYGGQGAPSLGSSGLADYQCAHNLLKAHAKAYHLYNEEYRATQKGRVGIVVDSAYYYTDDGDLRDRVLQFELGLYAHPVLSTQGNYPQTVIDRVAQRSEAEGFRRSRLPSFTSEEISMIRGTADYVGINHYTSYDVFDAGEIPVGEPNFYLDEGVITEKISSSVEGQNGWTMVPDGLRSLLNWISDEYNNPEIMVTENGFADGGGTDDANRKTYYQNYINAVLEALLEDGVNVTAYTAWSLMDNFEWSQGYTDHFGLYMVDFESDNRTRTIKKSGEFFQNVINTRCLRDENDCESESNDIKGENSI